jgi:hypothetical protein
MKASPRCRLRRSPEEVVREQTGTHRVRRYFGVPWPLLGRWTRYLFVFDEGTAYVVLGHTITDADIDYACEPEDHSGPTGRPTFVLAHSWASVRPETRAYIDRRGVLLKLVDDGCPHPNAAG